MKIVIDIPEEAIEFTQLDDGFSLEALTAFCAIVADAIRHGTLLPKGHGRLIDEKDLSLMTVHMIDGMFVCDAPTIIEADNTESEEI